MSDGHWGPIPPPSAIPIVLRHVNTRAHDILTLMGYMHGRFSGVVALAWFTMALSMGQTSAKKDQPAKTDTWQRSKECAVQAEKIMAIMDRQGRPSAHWENHYSPKYAKCFISATYVIPGSEGGGKTAPLFSVALIDAFERTDLADAASAGPTEGLCLIDRMPVACAKADAFISDHMKN